ncbi:hypothetical protein Nepgr_009294 [Nepenthes gracilis]|uniref:Uncharacterized protein n=1 Tax=Nepenthes gracilis TaxID=150966 RepID=A0AAD3XK75_NEPGR|nr:hypothetical protein Nepgr_009294 [Nepenthes gracilis]
MAKGGKGVRKPLCKVPVNVIDRLMECGLEKPWKLQRDKRSQKFFGAKMLTYQEGKWKDGGRLKVQGSKVWPK